ncbi:hypothetical protein [Mycobacterium leprae]|nr:hypothetical protein [Mycobacterium leprae]
MNTCWVVGVASNVKRPQLAMLDAKGRAELESYSVKTPNCLENMSF